MKIIEKLPFYTIYEDVFDGITLTFRRWLNEPEQAGADILLNDAFANACGYQSTDNMIASTMGEQGKRDMIAKFGYLPKWVRVLDDGVIMFVDENSLIGET